MNIPATDLNIKVKNIKNVKDFGESMCQIMKQIEKVREATPHSTIKVTIEVGIRS